MSNFNPDILDPSDLEKEVEKQRKLEAEVQMLLKKNKDDKINLILLKSIGKPLLNKSFRENNIRSFLKNLIY